MNHPDAPDDRLLASARQILTSGTTTFEVKPWREFMKNVAATTKAKEVKAAAKKIAAKTPPYKHEPGNAASASTQAAEPIQRSAFGSFAASQLGSQTREEGVDSNPSGAVQSGFPFTNNPESPMSDEVKTPTKQELAEKAAAEKMAAKAAKLAAAAEAKKVAQAERQAKIDARDRLMADKKAEREAAIAKAAAEPKAPRERHYLGPMLALTERVKSGVYVKGTNGQLRSDDPVAQALESVPAKKMVELLMAVFQTTENPYAVLNYGQQSMNFRNRLRGALRKGAEVGEGEAKVKITLDYVKQIRDDGGFATAEAEAAEKAAKKVEAPATAA